MVTACLNSKAEKTLSYLLDHLGKPNVAKVSCEACSDSQTSYFDAVNAFNETNRRDIVAIPASSTMR